MDNLAGPPSYQEIIILGLLKTRTYLSLLVSILPLILIMAKLMMPFQVLIVGKEASSTTEALVLTNAALLSSFLIPRTIIHSSSSKAIKGTIILI